MSTPENTIIEETWWEVTTSTGLILELPAPLQRIETSNDGTYLTTIANPLDVLRRFDPVQSYSEITKKHYFLQPRDILLVKPKQVKADPNKLAAALLRMQQRSQGGSSTSGQGADSQSDAQANPSGRSTGARIRPRTR